MAHIVPSISFLKDLKTEIARGLSVGSALQATISKQKTDYSVQVYLWFCHFQKTAENESSSFKTHYQRCFLDIVASGLHGGPVFEHLGLLEARMEEEFERQWKAHLETLPSKLSIPLLLFFFPAYVILLFGPLIMIFLSEVN